MNTRDELIKAAFSRKLPSGFSLSERVWDLSTYEKDIITTVENGLAQEFVSPELLSRQLDAFVLPGRQVITMTPYGRTLNFDSMRLARSEVLQSFRDAADKALQEEPWITGQVFCLNDAHEECGCECEDLDGEVFGPNDTKPSLADLHPHCGCYYDDQLMTDEEWDAALKAYEDDPSSDPYGIGEWMES